MPPRFLKLSDVPKVHLVVIFMATVIAWAGVGGLYSMATDKLSWQHQIVIYLVSLAVSIGILFWYHSSFAS